MKQLRRDELSQWLWVNLSSPVNTGTKTSSTPLYTFAQAKDVCLPSRLPKWARIFDERCKVLNHGTIRGATAYHVLAEIERG